MYGSTELLILTKAECLIPTKAEHLTSTKAECLILANTQRTVLTKHNVLFLHKHDVLFLQKNDVLYLERETKSPISIEVNGVKKFTGFQGAYKGHKAINIDELIYQPPDVDEMLG